MRLSRVLKRSQSRRTSWLGKKDSMVVREEHHNYNILVRAGTSVHYYIRLAQTSSVAILYIK